MQFLNDVINKNNPVVRGVFTQNFDSERAFPPPASAFRITDASELRVTDAGDKRITD